jgi:hypothetical protein
MEEHDLILDTLQQLVDRVKGPGASAPDIVRRSGEFASRLLAHEAREVELAAALA